MGGVAEPLSLDPPTDRLLLFRSALTQGVCSSTVDANNKAKLLCFIHMVYLQLHCCGILKKYSHH